MLDDPSDGIFVDFDDYDGFAQVELVAQITQVCDCCGGQMTVSEAA